MKKHKSELYMLLVDMADGLSGTLIMPNNKPDILGFVP
jgi:hypothetical protein